MTLKISSAILISSLSLITSCGKNQSQTSSIPIADKDTKQILNNNNLNASGDSVVIDMLCPLGLAGIAPWSNNNRTLSTSSTTLRIMSGTPCSLSFDNFRVSATSTTYTPNPSTNYMVLPLDSSGNGYSNTQLYSSGASNKYLFSRSSNYAVSVWDTVAPALPTLVSAEATTPNSSNPMAWNDIRIAVNSTLTITFKFKVINYLASSISSLTLNTSNLAYTGVTWGSPAYTGCTNFTTSCTVTLTYKPTATIATAVTKYLGVAYTNSSGTTSTLYLPLVFKTM